MQEKIQIKQAIFDHLMTILDLRTLDTQQLQDVAFQKNIETQLKQKLSENVLQNPQTQTVMHEVIRETLGLGPIEALLEDPNISEIMINGPSEIYVEHEGVIKKTKLSFISDESLRSIITRILSPLGRRLDESSPMVDARLQDGSRFNAIIPPLSLNGPVVTIRKFQKKNFCLPDLVEKQSLSPMAASFIDFCVQHKRNIIIAGGTGSGKTTFLNAVSKSIPKTERIVTIEDAAELKLSQKHTITLEARPANVENQGKISIRDLLKNALRMRPDRIIIGECRGEEALDMLQAMNTGHDGSLTTLHANSPRDALSRLETLILMAGFDLPLRAIREQIASSIDIIVYVSRFSDGFRGVTHITEVCRTESDIILTQNIFEIDRNTRKLSFTNQQPNFFTSLAQSEQQKGLQILFGESA